MVDSEALMDAVQKEQRRRVETVYGKEKFNISVFDMTPQPAKDVLPHHRVYLKIDDHTRLEL